MLPADVLGEILCHIALSGDDQLFTKFQKLTTRNQELLKDTSLSQFQPLALKFATTIEDNLVTLPIIPIDIQGSIVISWGDNHYEEIVGSRATLTCNCDPAMFELQASPERFAEEWAMQVPVGPDHGNDETWGEFKRTAINYKSNEVEDNKCLVHRCYIRHIFDTPGIYTVRVFRKSRTASLPAIRAPTGPEWWSKNLIEFLSLGAIGIFSLQDLFMSQWDFNLPLNHVDVSAVRYMTRMFDRALSFNQRLDSWNVSNVTTMDRMFSGAREFNKSLIRWNVRNVVSMEQMFSWCQKFNQPLNTWQTGSVVNMCYMFYGASAFNGSVGEWNVSNVRLMSGMFGCAKSFNQPIQEWNVSNVRCTNSMFQGACKFCQPLHQWKLNSVSDVDSMFHNVSDDFDFFYCNWDLPSHATGKLFGPDSDTDA